LEKEPNMSSLRDDPPLRLDLRHTAGVAFSLYSDWLLDKSTFDPKRNGAAALQVHCHRRATYSLEPISTLLQKYNRDNNCKSTMHAAMQKSIRAGVSATY
jgi:hypothetical protein